MSESYIPAGLRRLVISRANGRCEYCKIKETDTYFGCEVDHIISEKHGGLTDHANLAFACMTCNRAKGSDIATLDDKGNLIPLFHPRQHLWHEHFCFAGHAIAGLTAIGRATALLLNFNAPLRLAERSANRSGIKAS